MSEQAPERPAPQGGGFSLTKRYGPLPAWAWGLLGGIGVYAVYRFVQARKAAAAPAAGTTSDGGTQQTDYAPQIATLQAEIEQLQQGNTQQASVTAEQEQDITALEQGESGEPPPVIRKPGPKPPPRPRPGPKPPPKPRPKPKPRPRPRPKEPVEFSGGPMRRPV